MIKRIIFIPVFFVFVFTCKNAPLEISNTTVAGKWKAAQFESKVPDMPPEYAEAGEKEFLSSVYTLNPDMSMEMHSDYFTQGAKGHWELDPDTKEISMYYQYDTINGVEKYIVKSLTSHEMVLRQDIKLVDGFVQLTLQK